MGCKVDGCVKKVVAKGLCHTHYSRLRRHGHLDDTRPRDWGGRKSHQYFQMWTTRRVEGRRPMCEEWKNDFWKFVSDIGDRPTEDSRLRALEYSSPIGPGNWYWEEPVKGEEKRQDRANYQKEWARRKRDEDPEYWKRYDFKKNVYGISYEEFLEMERAQDDKCAICGDPEVALNPKTQKPRRLAVDHCHKSGKVRALLCTACNSGIGKFKDDPDLLTAAIAYLKKHSTAGA